MVAMVLPMCRHLLLSCVGIASFWIPGSRSGEASSALPSGESRTHYRSNKDWHTFGLQEYLFIVDSDHSLDRTRAHAKRNCQLKNADLASFQTEEELDFVRDEIGNQVRNLGQKLMTEQWWTNGISYRQQTWVWDTPWKPQVNISALRRSTVPRAQGPHFLALTHTAHGGGWRLKVTPGNYKLRSVCQRNRTFGLPSTPNTPQDEQNLLKDLLSTYDPTEAPPFPPDGSQIGMEIQLQPIQDNVTNTIIHVKQDIITKWVDPRLSWTPAHHAGIAKLPAASHRVWSPDVYSPREAPHKMTCHAVTSHMLVMIDASGEVNLRRTCDVTYNCSLQKPATFPFDHQHCRMLLLMEGANAAVRVSWSNPPDADRGLQRVWTVSSLIGGEDDASVVQLTLYLHRNVMYHVLTLIVPCVFLSMVLLILLWLPHGSGLKCVATFLVTVTFLLYLGLGGRFRENHSVSYSDMYMVVMSIIGIVALVTQMCILRLMRRHQKHLPPPPWIERVVINRSQKTVEKSIRDSQRKDSKPSKKAQRVVASKNLEYAKWMEEKELMLGDQPLGMTSLGSDARKPPHYVTHFPDSKCDGYKNPQVVISSRTSSLNKNHVHHHQHPNGTAKRHVPPPPLSKGTKYLNPGRYKETALFTQTKGADKYAEENREPADVSAGESFDSGCHSATKNSPDITVSTTQSIKDSQWKKCILWFDRAVSLVISAAVIITIMIFTILFLAT